MDRAKALDRIRKCMALSKSPNEHEAAAALRQAQALMRKFQVEADEVDLVEYVSDFVDHDDYKWGKKKPMTINCVAEVVCMAFGTSATWESSPTGMHRVRYFGKKANVMLSTHSHSVVYRAVNAAWREYLDRRPELTGWRGARASFVKGWCIAVAVKVANLSPDKEEEERIERAKEKHYGYEIKEAEQGTKKSYDSLVVDGHEAGKDFSINKPINADNRRLEKL